MLIGLDWRIYVLVAMSVISGASCSEAGRKAAEHRATADLDPALDNQASPSSPDAPSSPVDDLLVCQYAGILEIENLQLLHEYERLKRFANKNPVNTLLNRQLAIAGEALFVVQRRLRVAKEECERQIGINAPARASANSSKVACPASRVRELEADLQELLKRFTEKHPDVIALREQIEACTAQPQLRSGEWVKKDGAFVCDGYLTRSTDRDFCSPLPPQDWVPFTFEGQQYYVQPLGGPDGK